MAPDAKVNLNVWRNGAQRNFAVQLGEMASTMTSAKSIGEKDSSAFSGVPMENKNLDRVQQLKLPADTLGVAGRENGSLQRCG